jgi:tetratricopeptide (TPR) repeat protein
LPPQALAIQYSTCRRLLSRNRYAIKLCNAAETLACQHLRAAYFRALEANIMKRFITLFIMLALVAGLSALPLLAQQTGTVKGKAVDENGNAITDATVELSNAENGRKTELKLNNKGEYFSVGMSPGTYNIQLIRNGKPIDGFNKVPIAIGQEQTVNFDLKKDLAGSPGISEEQKKKIEEVKAQNEKIKGLNATLAQARDLEKAGNYDQAVALLKPAAEQNPSQDLLWGYLGDAYLKSKQYNDAGDAYQKAIALKPTSGGYHNALAESYAKGTPPQVDKAVQEYETAAKVEPANAAMYYFNEGAVFTNTGKANEAIAAFDKCIAADPNRAEAYYYKGENLISQAKLEGNKMVAPPGTAEAFQKYLELKPDGGLAAQAKAMLESLGQSVETSYGKGKSASKTPPKK